MEKKDWIIDEPMFKAKDGSYHADMESVRAINEFYWNSIMELKLDPNLDLPLTDEQLRRIVNNPSFGSLLSVLQDGLSKQLGEDAPKGMKK